MKLRTILYSAYIILFFFKFSPIESALFEWLYAYNNDEYNIKEIDHSHAYNIQSEIGKLKLITGITLIISCLGLSMFTLGRYLIFHERTDKIMLLFIIMTLFLILLGSIPHFNGIL